MGFFNGYTWRKHRVGPARFVRGETRVHWFTWVRTRPEGALGVWGREPAAENFGLTV